MKPLLDYLLELIFAQESKKIKVEISEEAGKTQITLRAPSNLIGRLIGRQGQTVKAFKTLLALQNRGQQPFILNIEEISSATTKTS